MDKYKVGDSITLPTEKEFFAIYGLTPENVKYNGESCVSLYGKFRCGFYAFMLPFLGKTGKVESFADYHNGIRVLIDNKCYIWDIEIFQKHDKRKLRRKRV